MRRMLIFIFDALSTHDAPCVNASNDAGGYRGWRARKRPCANGSNTIDGIYGANANRKRNVAVRATQWNQLFALTKRFGAMKRLPNQRLSTQSWWTENAYALIAVYNTSMWDGDRHTEFKCPLCGTDGYTRVIVKKPNGHWYTTEFYHCFGCSVMFTDPVKFTQQRQIVSNGPVFYGRYGGTIAANAGSEDETKN